MHKQGKTKMRKIMITAAAIVVAAIANAAAVNWQSGTIYVAADAAGTTGTSRANAGTRLVTAYLFALTAEEYATASAMDTAALYAQYITGNVAPTGTKTTSALGVANITQSGLADGSDAAPVTAYGLVLYVDTATAASYDNVDAFVKSYVGTTTWQDTTGGAFSNLAAEQANWTVIGTAVPEPTSGLLLLLGMAGLALKRKRA